MQSVYSTATADWATLIGDYPSADIHSVYFAAPADRDNEFAYIVREVNTAICEMYMGRSLHIYKISI